MDTDAARAGKDQGRAARDAGSGRPQHRRPRAEAAESAEAAAEGQQGSRLARAHPVQASRIRPALARVI